MINRCSPARASILGGRALCARLSVNIVRTAFLSDAIKRAPAAISAQPIHVTIVGGGAAGLTAAFFAAEHGAKVGELHEPCVELHG